MASDTGATQGEKPLSHWVAHTNSAESPQTLFVSNTDEQFTMLPRAEATRMGFPAKAACVLVSSSANKNEGLHALAAAHNLTLREQALVRGLVKSGDLKVAAADIGVSYESARTYLKRVAMVARWNISFLDQRTANPFCCSTRFRDRPSTYSVGQNNISNT